MGPSSQVQIRWAAATCVAVLVIVALLAFVSDPLFRYRKLTTTLDDVEGIQPGTKVFFRGAAVGDVSSVDLDPATRSFAVKLGVLKKWHPAACSFVQIGASNPFTSPRMDLVAVEKAATPASSQCQQAMAAASCMPIPQIPGGGSQIIGCRRSPDLIQTATVAVNAAASVAQTANQMAQRLQSMLQGSGGAGGSALDMASVARNATGTLAALSSLSAQLDRTLKPGSGDVALTLANVRQLTGRAAGLDIASANGILRETHDLVAKNQASIAKLLADGSGATTQARAALEDASSSMIQTSANIDRITSSLNILSEKMAADPTYVLRGQRYSDPPAPGGGK